MTKFDIKNYFQRIYGLDVYKVHTRIQQGMYNEHRPLYSARLLHRKGQNYS